MHVYHEHYVLCFMYDYYALCIRHMYVMYVLCIMKVIHKKIIPKEMTKPALLLCEAVIY